MANVESEFRKPVKMPELNKPLRISVTPFEFVRACTDEEIVELYLELQMGSNREVISRAMSGAKGFKTKPLETPELAHHTQPNHERNWCHNNGNVKEFGQFDSKLPETMGE